MRVVLKVRRKGVVILPKRLRETLGIEEGDVVVAEAAGGRLVMRVLKPRVVDVDPKLVEEILREEYDLEEGRYGRMTSGEEAGPGRRRAH